MVFSVPGATTVRTVLLASLASTGIHYTHNFVAAEDYPPVGVLGSAHAYQVGVLVSWPLLTAIGLYGYRRYLAGDHRQAGAALMAYSATGISTIFHFAGGNPDIPPLFYATIFTDFLTGVAVLVIALRLWMGRESG